MSQKVFSLYVYIYIYLHPYITYVSPITPLSKHLKRTGWVNHKVSEPETVSGHMYRMAMMSFLFGSKSNPSVDRDRYKYT